LLVGALGAAALSLLLGLFFSSTLTRPLKELINATRDVAQGNLEREVPVRSKDELGELTKSFNQMSSQLKQSRDLRRNMTADIAHELRTPLSIILGHAEALSEGKLNPSPETFDIVYDEAKRLSLLVEDLRTLSLSEAGELTLELQPLSPSDLIDRVVGAYLPKARTLDVSLETNEDASLPDINADSHRIIQVFGNLLENALRYTSSGGRIKLSARSVSDEVEFRIQDNGPGISEVDLPHIFDRFYRGDKSRSRQDGGSGLGLAISKSIIEAHDGRIWAESAVNEGTTIVFVLPMFKNI
jgi:two-component system, OmpR family, sensor histidine kinase BaeS